MQKGFRFNECMQIHFGIADAHFICVLCSYYLAVSPRRSFDFC